MDLQILDPNFRTLSILDDYKSLVWTDRYSSYGDIDIYIPESSENVNFITLGNYVYSKNSEHLMIIDTISYEEDSELGNYVSVLGRSLECILSRRIIWEQTVLDGSFEDQIEKLLNENVINPKISERRIDNFVFERSGDSRIEALKLGAQFTGDNLYEAIKYLCDSVNIGFKITLTETNKFLFKLYKGADRSYAQDIHPYVVFSPFYENLLNNSFLKSDRNFKNVALVAGEGEGKARKTLSIGSEKGLYRREAFIDARDISSNVGSTTLSKEKYDKLLMERGKERLSEYVNDKIFDGEIETSQLYRYKTHFFMGDIVQLEDRHHTTSPARIVEFIHSYDSGNVINYPSLSIIDKEEQL